MYTLAAKAIVLTMVVFITIFYIDLYYSNTDIFNRYYEKSYRAASGQGDNDVVIIGASHGSHGINPKHLESSGKKIYNFCINGAGPEFFYDWMTKLYANVREKPEIVVYEVDWFIFDSDWLERRFELDSRFIDLPVLLELVAKGKIEANAAIKNYFTIFTKQQPIVELLMLVNKKPEHYVLGIDKYYKGYVPFEYLYSKESLNEKKYKPAKFFVRQRNYFEKLLDYFADTGIRVVFVQTPEYINGRDDKNAVFYNKMIKKIAAERNITFLNYNDELVSFINYAPNFYSDWGHLNEVGSRVFTERLSSDLKNLISSETPQ